MTFNYTVDDPLITLRYASNLVHGHGAVFNVGERVEGYSSALHLLVAMGALLVPGGHDLLKLKLLSLLGGAIALVAADRLGRALGLSPAWRTGACVVIGADTIFATSAGNGLETSLAALLITALIAALIARPDAGWRSAAGLLAVLLVLCRPEGIALVGALVVGRVALPGRRLRGLAWAVPALGAAGAQTALRLMYYGQPLVNTYYAKRLDTHSALHGAKVYLLALTGNAWSHSHGTLAAAVVGTVCAGLALAALLSRRETLLPLGAVAAQLVFVVMSGGDWVPGGRFIAPALPALVVVLAVGANSIAGRLRGTLRWSALAGTIALAAGVTVLPYRTERSPVWHVKAVSDAGLIATSPVPLAPVWAGVAQEPCVRPGMTVAYSEVGLFGFVHRDVRILDTRGLTDRVIATRSAKALHHPWGVEDPNWADPTSVVGSRLLRVQPDLIIEFNPTAVPAAFGGRYLLVRDEPAVGIEHTQVLRRSDVACPEG